MGIADRKERQKAELRDQILEAARKIVSAEGMEALTIRRIASAIEYAPGTIYLYFANRDEIAKQLVRDGFNELVAYLTPAASLHDPVERLDAIGRAYSRFAIEQPETYRTIFLQSPGISGELVDLVNPAHDEENDPGNRAFNILAFTVSELMESGRFRRMDPRVAAETIWGWIHGIMALKLQCTDEMLTDFDASVDLTISGIHRAFAP